MRIALVTPRYGAQGAVPAERLAEELVEHAPDSWSVSVFTTTVAGPDRPDHDDGAGEDFREGSTQSGRAVIHRFRPEAAAAPERSAAEIRNAPPGSGLRCPALIRRLAADAGDHDLVAVFGAEPRLAAEAVAVAPERTVLLPFVEGLLAGGETLPASVFERPAAFVFGSEAEEMAVVDRYRLHRRMRETVSGALLLQRAVVPDRFREAAGIRGPHLVYPGPLRPGRGVEELLRYFTTFVATHPRAGLDLVVFAPAGIPLPRRPEVRLVVLEDAQQRLDAIAGGLLAVLPARLSSFRAQGVEPLSLGAPLLVNASASELVEVCRASNGGLYYGNYEEFELILEMALRDPALFARLGDSGREYLTAQNDWQGVVEAYDHAFRSFARPPRAGADSPPAAEAAEVVSGKDAATAEAPHPEPVPAGTAPLELDPVATEPVETEPVEPALPEPAPAEATTAEATTVESDSAATEAAEANGEGPAATAPAADTGESSEEGEEESAESGNGPKLSGFFGSSIRR